jgi:hypothetical protein
MTKELFGGPDSPDDVASTPAEDLPETDDEVNPSNGPDLR